MTFRISSNIMGEDPIELITPILKAFDDDQEHQMLMLRQLNKNKMSILSYVVSKSSPQCFHAIVSILEQDKALFKRAIEHQDIKGKTAFSCALENSNLVALNKFLSLYQNDLKTVFDIIEKRYENNGTVLMSLAKDGNLSMIKWLFKLYENYSQRMMVFINRKDTRGSTALFFAALKGKLDVIMYLASIYDTRESLLEAVTRTAWFPQVKLVDLARNNGHQHVVDYLVTLEEVLHTELITAAVGVNAFDTSTIYRCLF